MSDRIRVAMVGPYPVDRGLTNGVEAVTVGMVELLRARPDIDLHVITTVFDGESETRELDDLTVHTVGSSDRFRRITFYRGERAGIAETIDRIAPDLVHVQGANFYAVGALAADRPTVVTLHGMLFREARIVDPRSSRIRQAQTLVRGYFNARFEAMVLKRARHIITISEYVNRCIAGRTDAELYAIANPIDEPFFGVEARPEPGRILFLGRIEPRKGQHHLVEAVRVLRAEGVDVELRLVGKEVDPGYAASIRELVAEHDLGDAVTFVGVVSDDEVLEEYARASLLMMASREETSPMVIQQAMAAKVPSVAPDVAGIPFLVDHEVNGLVVDSPDGQDDGLGARLAAAARRLLDDEALREAFGKAGHEKATARFRAVTVGDETVAVYRRILGRSDGAADPR